MSPFPLPFVQFPFALIPLPFPVLRNGDPAQSSQLGEEIVAEVGFPKVVATSGKQETGWRWPREQSEKDVLTCPSGIRWLPHMERDEMEKTFQETG